MLGAQLLGDGDMFPGLGNAPICAPTHKDGSVRYVVGLDPGESVFRKHYSFFLKHIGKQIVTQYSAMLPPVSNILQLMFSKMTVQKCTRLLNVYHF